MSRTTLQFYGMFASLAALLFVTRLGDVIVLSKQVDLVYAMVTLEMIKLASSTPQREAHL